MEEKKVDQGNVKELLLKLEMAELLYSRKYAEIITNSNTDFAIKMKGFLKNERLVPTSSPERAREIMGKNYLGVEEGIKRLRIKPTREQLATFSKVPFFEAVLEGLKNDFILAAVFPLSPLEILARVDEHIFGEAKEYCRERPFAKECGQASWQLVPRCRVNYTKEKLLEGQQRILGLSRNNPTAQVVLYAIVGHYLATGEKVLNEDSWKYNTIYTSSRYGEYYIGIRFYNGELYVNGFLSGD
jgi:hypothetical protein